MEEGGTVKVGCIQKEEATKIKCYMNKFGEINRLMGKSVGSQMARDKERTKYVGSKRQGKGKKWVRQEISHRKVFKQVNGVEVESTQRMKKKKVIWHDGHHIRYMTKFR